METEKVNNKNINKKIAKLKEEIDNAFLNWGYKTDNEKNELKNKWLEQYESIESKLEFYD